MRGFTIYWNIVMTILSLKKPNELAIRGNTIFFQNLLVIIRLIRNK